MLGDVGSVKGGVEMFWTDERVSQFKALRGEGFSFAKCAKALGCTRNAATSKWQRLSGRHLKGGIKKRASTWTAGRIPYRWSEEALTQRWADRR